MAAAKRFTTEQIVAKLREAEMLQGQGLTIPQLRKRLGVSDQSIGSGLLGEEFAGQRNQWKAFQMSVAHAVAEIPAWAHFGHTLL